MHTFTGKVLTDREALHAEAVQSIAAQARLTNKPRSTLIGGGTALIIVDWDLEAMLPDGTRISPTGTTTAVARCSADGSWRDPARHPRSRSRVRGSRSRTAPSAAASSLR
jgi:hypothetical protein